jgi:hypothetical protein
VASALAKVALCALVLGATMKIMADLRVLRKRATSCGESPAGPSIQRNRLRYGLSERVLGLPFQPLNFGQRQIALANGDIALLKISVALPHCIFQLRQSFLQSHLSHLEFLS